MAGIRLQMPPWATQAQTGFREGARFGWEAEEDLNGEGKFQMKATVLGKILA